MKEIAVTAVMIFSSAMYAQDNRGDVIFRGVLTGPWQGHKVFLYNNITKENDSANVVNGAFTISRKFSVPTRYLFYSTYDTKVKRMYVPFGVLVGGPCTVMLKTDITQGFYKSEVSGSPQHALYEVFIKKQEAVTERMKEELGRTYGKEFVAKPDEKSLRYPDFEAEREKLESKYLTPLVESMVRKDPDAYASVFVLNRFSGSLGLEKREELLKLLSPTIRSIYEGRYLADQVAGEKKSAIGSKVEDFALKTPENNLLRFSSLKGKYVLIDFWASWCGPCREEFKNLRQLYPAFKDKNFEILGVSTDKNREAWLKAIKDEKLDWLQVRDNEGDDGIAVSAFAVTAIPKTFLVDPDGTIVAKDLRGEELKTKLAQLLQ